MILVRLVFFEYEEQETRTICGFPIEATDKHFPAQEG